MGCASGHQLSWSLLLAGAFLLCQAHVYLPRLYMTWFSPRGGSHSEDALFAGQTGFFDHVVTQALGSYSQCCVLFWGFLLFGFF